MPDDQAQTSDGTPQIAPTESEPTLPDTSTPAEPVSEATTQASEPQPPPEIPTAQIPANEPLPHDEPVSDTSSAHTPSKPVLEEKSPESRPSSSGRIARDLLVKARATIQQRKQKKLEKILNFLTTNHRITNDEVEKLLHVSDATATRYLSALEREGKIKQSGITGHAVFYTRVL